MNILYVTSSSRGSASYSNRVAHRGARPNCAAAIPARRVTVRDLAREPLPHIDDDFVAATRGRRTARRPTSSARCWRSSDALVDELLAADVVVIAAPMINFTIPSTLKSWIDYVARAGRTFRYSEKGPKGLVTGKQVILVAARGGVYADAEQALDFQVPYLKSVLGFLGMTDVDVLEVEGTAFGPDAAEKAVAAATAKLHAQCDSRVRAAAA